MLALGANNGVRGNRVQLLLALIAVCLPDVLALNCARTDHIFLPPSPPPVVLDIEECAGNQVIVGLLSKGPVAEVEYSCIDPTSTGSEENGALLFGEGNSEEELRSITDLAPGFMCTFSGCYYDVFVDFTIQPTSCTVQNKGTKTTQLVQIYSSQVLTSVGISDRIPTTVNEVATTALFPPLTGSHAEESRYSLPFGSTIATTAVASTVVVNATLPDNIPQHSVVFTTSKHASMTYGFSTEKNWFMEPRWIGLTVAGGVTVSSLLLVCILQVCVMLRKRRKRQNNENLKRYYFEVFRGQKDEIDYNFKPVQGFGESPVLKSTDSLVTVYEVIKELQDPKPTVLQWMIASETSDATTPGTDCTRRQEGSTNNISDSKINSTSCQHPDQDRGRCSGQTDSHGMPQKFTRSSVCSDYICAH